MLLINTALDPVVFYRTVPVPLDGPCGTPRVLEDGTIEYPFGDPPEIAGYVKIGRTFRPNWPRCRWLAFEVTHPNGCIYIAGKCTLRALEPTAPDDCAACEMK